MEEFLNIPKFMWECIFSFIEVLLIGGILGAIIASVQKKREIELKIMGDVILRRLKAYEELEEIIDEIYKQIAPPFQTEQIMGALVDNLDIPYDGCMYPTFFDSENKFDDYVRRFNAFFRKNHIVLDGRLLERIHNLQSYFDLVKMMLDTYHDMEHTRDYYTTEQEAKRKIQMAYQTFGVLLASDMTRFYALIDQCIANEVRNIRLGFRDRRLYQYLIRKNEDFYLWVESHFKPGKHNMWIVRALIEHRYGKSPIYLESQKLIILLFHIHETDAHWTDLTESMSEDVLQKELDFFFKMFSALYHV